MTHSPPVSRRAFIAGATVGAVGAVGCGGAAGSAGAFPTAASGGLWTSEFFEREPYPVWVGRGPVWATKRLAEDPVDVFGDEDFSFVTWHDDPQYLRYFSMGGSLPCGRLEYLVFRDSVNLTRSGKVVVVRGPNPRFDAARIGWIRKGTSPSGVTQFQVERDRDTPLTLFVFPDRTHVFALGILPVQQMAAAFSRSGSPPRPISLPADVVIAEDSEISIRELGELMGYALVASRKALLYRAAPGVDARLDMRFTLGEQQAQDSLGQLRQTLPPLQRELSDIMRREGCRKPWNHFLATVSEVHVEGSELVLRGTYPSERYALYLSGTSLPRGC